MCIVSIYLNFFQYSYRKTTTVSCTINRSKIDYDRSKKDRSTGPDHSSHRRTSTSRDRSIRPEHSAHSEAFDPRPRPRATDRSFRSDHSHPSTNPGEGTRTVTGSHREQYMYQHKSW
ncbi:unnamed protein product [Didymodactylos carnosus]|uniref:Uncharacterized protein n=1 Tax=Didymodactylos carnosus TaxID=1234261 RepID=A0A813ZN78_9BILA|nr:unnamed protein product [Didymodactylos carnosus]CAF1194151.1 unnamed protein product [Didymodactylos carnosus]CAF3682927.1 unnamed protein product [Didymodactylos carnosus]CAF4004418.1 unnamed protein product [Didymodactylos carnosus]